MLKKLVGRLWFYLKQGVRRLWNGLGRLAAAWPKAFAGVVVLMVLLYYPLGGMWIENIDRTPDYDLSLSAEKQSPSLETMAFLINREVNENKWIANLPLIFPSYFLDNMPSFQSGIIAALANMTAVTVKQTECAEKDNMLVEAAELLKYPGNVWLFAADNKLRIAPSSASQYRKARKKIRDFNLALTDGSCIWTQDNGHLQQFAEAVRHDLEKSAVRLEKHIDEHSSDWTDTEADDRFYYNQGKIYAYMLVMKALGKDFKQILIDSGQYQNWTMAIRALENGSQINPSIVRNGVLNGSNAANHLISLAYYMLRAAGLLGRMNFETEGMTDNEN